LADIDIDVRQILKQILKVFNMRLFIVVAVSEYEQEAGSSEHVNGP
jgi:hypothetical protein